MGKNLSTESEVHVLIDFLSENFDAYTTGVKVRFYGSCKQHLEQAGSVESTTQTKRS